MKPGQYEQFRIPTKKYNIHFDGPVQRTAWPPSHREIFLDVQKLGTAVFNEYCERSVIDSLKKPWKASTRRRTDRLTALADLCRRERRNEAGWRMVVETKVMVRFTIEVAYPNCRKRLWRSEIEVTLDDRYAALDSLERRRMRREPCNCVSVTRGEDYLEQVLNSLFSDRAQEFILHDASVRPILPKQEQPDRVYGLRSTNNFQRLLKTLSDREDFQFPGQQKAKDLKTSPFRQDGDPLLFPFLVLEAKSEKGEDSFDSIEMQTAFSIRTILEHILDIWNGRITCKDDALRLLLIVDYIFDWARDLYRPTIYRHLKMLAAGDTASLRGDSDIFSLADPVKTWLNEPQPEEDQVVKLRSENESGILPSLQALDSEHGWIRHASVIRSLLLGLHITPDNIDGILLSLSSPAKAEKLAREILKIMTDSCRIDAETLDALETMWTGHCRPREESSGPHTIFYVTFAFAAYVSPLWDQVREFSYVAVAEDAVESLLRHANFGKAAPGINLNQREFPMPDRQFFENLYQRVQSASILENLHAAKDSVLLAGRRVTRPSASMAPHAFELREDSPSGPTIVIEPDVLAQTRRVVTTIYSLHQIGRKEPSESFLRHSKRDDKQSQGTPPSFVWPTARSSSLSGAGMILLDLSPPKLGVPYWCLYLADEPYENLAVWDIVHIVQRTISEGFSDEIFRRDLDPNNMGWSKDVGRYRYRSMDKEYHDKFNGWLAHLKRIAKTTASPRPDPREQVQQTSDKVHATNRSSPSPINDDLDETRTLDFPSAPRSDLVKDVGFRKRNLEVIDITDDDDEPGTSKRHQKVFDSDCLTDEALQQLLDAKHFGDSDHLMDDAIPQQILDPADFGKTTIRNEPKLVE